MKQLIVCAALLPLLLAVIMQFMLMEHRYVASVRAEGAVRTAASVASYEGGFSPAAEKRMCAEIAAAFGISEDSISATLDRGTASTAKTLFYEVTFPTGKLIATPHIFGLSEKDNEGMMTLRGEIPNLLSLPAAPAAPEKTPETAP